MPVTRPQAWQGVIAAYRDRLPVTTDTPVVTLHEGGTPLLPAPVLSAALYQRFSSRGEADYQDKLLSAMRYSFGGHLEKGSK